MAYPAPIFLANRSIESYASALDSQLADVYQIASTLQGQAIIKRNDVLRLIQVCGNAIITMDAIRAETGGNYTPVLLALQEILKAKRNIDKTLIDLESDVTAIYTAVNNFKTSGISSFPTDVDGYVAAFTLDADGQLVSGNFDPVPGVLSTAINDLVASFG